MRMHTLLASITCCECLTFFLWNEIYLKLFVCPQSYPYLNIYVPTII